MFPWVRDIIPWAQGKGARDFSPWAGLDIAVLFCLSSILGHFRPCVVVTYALWSSFHGFCLCGLYTLGRDKYFSIIKEFLGAY